MTLEVVRAGAMLTVQDAGRAGHSSRGVSLSGPMDPPALALANAMVGNPSDAAGLEFAGVGGEFRAGRHVRVALAGDAEIRIGDRVMMPGRAHDLARGEVLRIGALQRGVWGYLGVSGGIDVPMMLGSRSTHLRFGLGGLDGRMIGTGDILPLGEGANVPCLQDVSPDAGIDPAAPIRVVMGPQEDYFDDEVRATFLGEAFTVTPRSDRMGMALAGPTLAAAGGHDIISDGVVPGSIQVPGAAQPIVLMAECQTTGGYPKIATVIGADLPRLAQSRPGSVIRFEAVTQAAAEEAWRQAVRASQARIAALRPAVADVLSSDLLLSRNLIGGVWKGSEAG